jgi:hypothetical protein
MPSLVEMLVALEMMVLPAWVGAAMAPPPRRLGRRFVRAAAAVVAVTVVLLALAAMVSAQLAVAALRAQAVAAGFLILLVGLAAAMNRLAGPRATQMLTALLGWLLLGAVVLAGPLVELVGAGAKESLVRAVVYANPLVVAEHELGLKWLHQSLTYRLTPVGESYAYLFIGLAWWKTLLGHAFVGSGLFVFSLRHGEARQDEPAARAGDG